MAYRQDEHLAKLSEHELAQILESQGWTTSVTPSNQGCIFYDVTATSGSLSVSYEVKTDYLASTTGNVAIEVARDGNPTGVHQTIADYWAHRVDDTFYVYEVRQLKSLLKSFTFRHVKGGDGYRTAMALVPLQFFKDNAEFTITCQKLTK
jgi:hypothetical protein